MATTTPPPADSREDPAQLVKAVRSYTKSPAQESPRSKLPVNGVLLIVCVLVLLLSLVLVLQAMPKAKPCEGPSCLAANASGLQQPEQPPETDNIDVQQDEEPEAPPQEAPEEPHAYVVQEQNETLDYSLLTNVFYDTIGVETENEYKRDGFVVIRYFYNNNCQLCLSPVDWKSVLMEIASEEKDVVILEIFDSFTNRWAKQNWAIFGQDIVDDPVIRMEGMPGGAHAYKLYFAALLTAMQSSPKEKLEEELCKYTDKC